MTKQCAICSRMIHEGDEITAVVTSVFHRVPSEVLYAIEQPTACYAICHSYCKAGEEVEL